MRQPESLWRWCLKRLAYLLAATFLVAYLLGLVITRAAGGSGSQASWSAPQAKTIKRISPAGSAQREPVAFYNLDCQLMDYRLVGSGVMRSGCFTPTAFGLMESDTDTVIFNGTDEALQLLPLQSGHTLVPWPEALNLIAFLPISTGGSYLGLYKNPLTAFEDQRDNLFRLTGKKLTKAPDLFLTAPNGQKLVFNSQSLAVSDGGAWLVAETINGGSFVRVNLATLDMVAFAPAFASQGASALSRSIVAVSQDGDYVAVANKAATSFKVYDLTTCSGPVSGLQPQACQSYDYWPFVKQQIGGFQSPRHVRFVNDGLLNFEALTNNPASGGIYGLAPRERLDSLTDYLGLGDSYTSGEGAFDYLAGTDTGDSNCHLSVWSYPLRITKSLFSGAGGHSVACSGAIIKDVGSSSPDYRGQVRGVPAWKELRSQQPALLDAVMANFAPGYVAQQRFVGQYQPAVITVSVGGNDIGFGDILAKCVMPRLSRQASGNTCYNTYEDRLELTRLIDRTSPRWTALYQYLTAQAPAARVYALGYPQVAYGAGNCAVNVKLDKSELEFTAMLTDYLNGHIRRAAAKAGVQYVDISRALYGHRLCEAASHIVAVNGLTAGHDAGFRGIKVFGRESYHPNALGHELVAQAILSQTNNLTSGGPAVAGPVPDLLQAPKTNRPVNTVVPGSNMTPGTARPGQPLPLRVDGADAGLKPNTVYSVRLDGAGGPVIGLLASDSSGALAGSVTIPPGTAPGGHSIDVTGENQAGQPVDVTQPIYVPVSDNDADGDGIPNALDTCPAADNSGQDADQDGTDDACDGFIGPPPSLVARGRPTGPAGKGSQANTTAGPGKTLGLNHGRQTWDTGQKPRAGLYLVIFGDFVKRAQARPWPALTIVAMSLSLAAFLIKRRYQNGRLSATIDE